MDERKFLSKIRKLQESGEKIGLTEFPSKLKDGDKFLMSENKIILKEDDVQTVEPDEQRDEENKFRDTVTNLVKFQPIKVHKENVVWSGYLVREKIRWNYSLDESVGCYIQSMGEDDTSSSIQLTDETLTVIKKIRGYYDVWSEEWASRLTGGSAEETGEEGTTGGEGPAGEFGF
jgi:hypothetical protein